MMCMICGEEIKQMRGGAEVCKRCYNEEMSERESERKKCAYCGHLLPIDWKHNFCDLDCMDSFNDPY